MADTSSPDRNPTWIPSTSIAVEDAEAALVENYPRLVRLAYLVLPPTPSRHHRVLTAHATTQASLPHFRTSTSTLPLPGPRTGIPGWAMPDPAYVWLRLRVLRRVLEAERPRRAGLFRRRRAAATSGRTLPWVVGLRLFPQVYAGGCALDDAFTGLPGAVRAAYVLRHLEGLADPDIRRLLRAARVPAAEADAAPAAADRVRGLPDGGEGALLEAAECDPCTLHVRPTDLLRRRQHRWAGVAAAVALLACGGLVAAPGGWGPAGPGHASAAYGTAGPHGDVLDPAAVSRVPADSWRTASRTDHGAWPARGALRDDASLLHRALSAWARPDDRVRVTAARGTQTGPPPGPPQLLYAGQLDGNAVVLLFDGARVARYAEPLRREELRRKGATLELARTAGASTVTSGAVVVSRGEEGVRYLTAPWVREASVLDLLDPGDEGRVLPRDTDGVTAPVPRADTHPRRCERWPALGLSGSEGVAEDHQLYADLGELTPARLADGRRHEPATSAGARHRLARTACHFPAILGSGVKTVTNWEFARQTLPEGDGAAAWVCTRAATWRGAGARVMAQFQPPTRKPGRPGAAAARAEDTAACGRVREAMAGVLWKSSAGHWYVLAAADKGVVSLRAQGEGVRGGAVAVPGHTLAVRAAEGARARLSGVREDGRTSGPLS
ncbi:hypothetical protein [Streptomyces cacaoi]